MLARITKDNILTLKGIYWFLKLVKSSVRHYGSQAFNNIFRNLSPLFASTFLLIDTILRQTLPTWQLLIDSA